MKNLKLFLAVLYIPIFAAIFLNPYNIKFYLLIYASVCLLLLSMPKDSNKYFFNRVVILMKFSIVFLLYSSFMEYIHGTSISLIIRGSLPYILSIGIIIFLSKFNKERLIRFIEESFFYIGIFFIIQLVLSAYESVLNIYLVKEFNWALPDMYNSMVGNRFFLNIFGIDTSFLNIFLHPFSGILGQHNYWAYQLPFYNLIFLIIYQHSKKKYFLVLIILVIIAALLNTTRAAILTIFVTNIIYFLYLKENKNNRFNILKWLIFILTAYIISKLAVNFLEYFERTDTLTIRFEWYNTFFQHIFTEDFPFLFGYGTPELDRIMNKLKAYNFESAFFSLLYTYGFMGLIIFLYLAVSIWRQAKRLSKPNNYFNYLLVMNIVGVSLTIGGVLNFFTFQFVILFYIYSIITDRNYIESRVVDTYLFMNKESFVNEPIYKNYTQ